MPDIVVMGVFNADAAYRATRLPRMGETLAGVSFSLGAGGKGSNQAIAAARLGADVGFVTSLGDDYFGKMARDIWRESGVTPLVTVSEAHATGSAFIFIDHKSGENAIIIAPGAAGHMCAEDAERVQAEIAAAKVFLTQLEHPLDAARRGLEIARAAGVRTILNPAPATALPDSFLRLCDIVTPNETEAGDLTGIDVRDEKSAGAAVSALRARGVADVIITMGSKGVYVSDHGMVPAQRLGRVVDTTGAGDAFNGALATGLAEGMSLVAAATFGTRVAGLAVTKQGAAAGMPTRAEVDAVQG